MLKESLRIAEMHEPTKIIHIDCVHYIMHINYTNYRGFTSCLGDFTNNVFVGLSREVVQHNFSYEENKESGHKRRGLLRDEGGRVEE